MSTSPNSDPDVANVPVNVAKPDWKCPHCGTRYGQDLEKATACAEAGPAPDVTEGIPVLIVPSAFRNGPTSGIRLGLTTVGPVRPHQAEDGSRTHERDIVVGKRAVTAQDVADAHRGLDGLRIIVSDRAEKSTPDATPTLHSYSPLTRLFASKDGRYGRRGERETWIPSAYRDRDGGWYLPPNEEQRAALDVVTDGFVTKVADADPEKLLEATRNQYGFYASNRRSGQWPQDLTIPHNALMLADAHGAPNHIWAMRWINRHFEQVTAHHVQMVQQWAAGDGGPIPLRSRFLWSTTLPKNPGKRRLAVMEPFGWDYRQVRDNVMAQLRTHDAPISPVPNVQDVTTTLLHPTTKGGADDV